MQKKRIASIDVFRALTMLLMVFVNDLWTVHGVPPWLEHASASADAMGFADTIFPAFLFLVGLSLPFALENRIARGQSRRELFFHILLRSLALIIMGFFQMNLENYSHQAMLPRAVWEIVITVAFFLIWLDYSERFQQSKKWLQILGVLMLIFAAIVYRGETNGQLVWLQPHWWGILGLIGWAYFACATLLLIGGEKLPFLIIAFLVFLVINASARLHAPAPLWSFDDLVARLGLGDGSNSSITMAGVIISVLYRKWQDKPIRYASVFLAIAAAFFLVGFLTRPLWGISKIRATPSWTLICNGISLLVFCVLIYLVDRRGKRSWFKLIKPAGTSTLTCYLLPYLHGAIFLSLLGLRLPDWIRTGWIGIVKSLLFALIIVLVTGLLEKKRLRLKI